MLMELYGHFAMAVLLHDNAGMLGVKRWAYFVIVKQVFLAARSISGNFWRWDQISFIKIAHGSFVDCAHFQQCSCGSVMDIIERIAFVWWLFHCAII